MTARILDALNLRPFLAACARTQKSLGTDRPLSAYLADLERQIIAQCDQPGRIANCMGAG